MNKVFIDGSQFIQSSVYGCEFRNCSKVIIAGSVYKCSFINCGIVGMGELCYNSKFINCTKISIKKLCDNSNFKNCEIITVGWYINDCIRDGEPYEDRGGIFHIYAKEYYIAPHYIPNDYSAPLEEHIK